MRSRLPKALHCIGGRPMLDHLLETVAELAPTRTLVTIGHGAEQVQAAFSETNHELIWVHQARQLGTGHAVQQALAQAMPQPATDDGLVLVLYADVPLVSADTLKACIDGAGQGLCIVTAEAPDPAALGRIKRNADGEICGIVEYADATDHERAIREINTGIMALPAHWLLRLVADVQANNAQGEFYLTDVVAGAVAAGLAVHSVRAASAEEVLGVNDRAQLAGLERFFQRREAQRLMAAGVTLADPERLDIRGRAQAGQDCFIDVNVVLQGDVRLGERVHLGPGVVLQDTTLADDVRIEPYSVVHGARIGARSRIGPFARLRPGAELAQEVSVGNFVEVKQARLDAGVKANHLAYLGDARIGAGANVGAGVITCNYDGADKHPTHIGEDVFIGSNATLVAPVQVAAGAYIAAGSTITTAVREQELAVARGRQRNISGWQRPGSKPRDD